MALYNPHYNGASNNIFIRVVDLKKEGSYIDYFRKIVIDKYIPDDIYTILSLNLPIELINLIVLQICDKIVIKYNNYNLQFINPYTNLVLKTQEHNIDNYYYIFPSIKNDDIYVFFVNHKKIKPEYLNIIGDDVYSIRTESLLQCICLLPDVSDIFNSDDILYLDYMKKIYTKVNNVREEIINKHTRNIYADYRYQFSSNYEFYIIRHIVSSSNNIYNISVYKTDNDELIISKNIEFNIIVNDNMLSPVINNNIYLIFVSLSKCIVSNKLSIININIYNIKTLELIKTIIKDDYISSLGVLDIMWENNSIKLYNNYTNWSILIQNV